MPSRLVQVTFKVVLGVVAAGAAVCPATTSYAAGFGSGVRAQATGSVITWLEPAAGARVGRAAIKRWDQTIGMGLGRATETRMGQAARIHRYRAAGRRRGARVDVMVVGRSRIVAQPIRVRARSVKVRVGHRLCKVPASTPLAALVAAARARHFSYRLRDFGRCSRRTADAALLFVDRVARDRSEGADGWVYKVGRRAGSAGAADPAGPFGRGRLRNGKRVLWFWCLNQGGGDCQPTLEERASVASGVAGATVSVRVRGYKNDGHGAPVAQAKVSLAGMEATTDQSGRATFGVTMPGRYKLTASKDGTVSGFPVEVVVP